MEYPDYYWLNDESRLFLERGYLEAGVSPEQRFRNIAEHAQLILGIPGFADKFESYIKKGWYSLASPIISNFGVGRGLPISCFGSYADDTIESILYKQAEIGMMTKYGGGTSLYLGALRPRGDSVSVGGSSGGPIHFAELFESCTNVISQSNIRRGHCAVYLPVDHPDIYELLHIRSEASKIQNLSIGVCIPDWWMHKLIEGDKEIRKLWAAIIKKRFESGYPYILFSNNCNNGYAPQVYQDKGLEISASNMCVEIMLSSSPDESFVCCLSSMNLLHFDEWKETDAVEVLTFFLDAVMSEFIKKAENITFMGAPYRFAVKQRALGLGVLGWHSYLQSKMVPFESMQAKYLNTEIWKHIRSQSHAASRKMAIMYGEPELLRGYGMRNVTTMAVAPTTSSSFILGQVSPSIEPLNSNYFVKDLAKGKFAYKNPFLADLLETKEKNNSATWKSILQKGGSVQHLDFLSQEEKDVFKTFGEISQKEVLIQAAARQKYIDQGQSINLMIHPDTSSKEVSDLMIFAWEQKIKTLYYQRNTSPTQELGRTLMNCVSCEA